MINPTTLIATLDLLGIKQLILNIKAHQLEDLANSIDTARMAACDKTVVMKNATITERVEASTIVAIADRIHSLMFSDTIVFTCNLADSIIAANIDLATNIFFASVAVAASEFFKAGFPVRGCIDIGYVKQKKDFVVGVQYVKSLMEADSLDFSGVVISDGAYGFYREIVGPKYQTARMVECLVVVKDKKKQGGGLLVEEKRCCLDWTRLPFAPLVPNDIFRSHESVERLFSAHGKSIDKSVHRKIVNTENVVRIFEDAFVNEVENGLIYKSQQKGK